KRCAPRSSSRTSSGSRSQTPTSTRPCSPTRRPSPPWSPVSGGQSDVRHLRDRQRQRPPDLVLLSRMMGRLGHRGPDGNGWYRDRRTALGHTRLAIIDTSGGAQPLCNEDGTVWVTYNGEIF